MSGNPSSSPIFKQLLSNIAKLLLAIIESDKKCDIRKEVLCEIKRFKPAEFFETLCTRTTSANKQVSIKGYHSAHKPQQQRPQQQSGTVPISTLKDWLGSRDVLTSEDELASFISAFRSSRYISGVNGSSCLTYRDFLEFIVLPVKKDKLREKVLKRSGLKGVSAANLKKKKKMDNVGYFMEVSPPKRLFVILTQYHHHQRQQRSIKKIQTLYFL